MSARPRIWNGQLACRNSAAKHEGVLSGSYIKEAMIPKPERVRFIWKLVQLGVGDKLVPSIEPMLFFIS
jgi:hypothetical protein